MKPLLLLIVLIAATVFAEEAKPVKLYTIMPGADIILKDDYGAILVNEGGEKNPSARYILGIQSTGKVVDTRDPKIFWEQLRQLPNKSVIVMYDSCTVPRSWGLPEKTIKDFEEMIVEAGHTIPEDVQRITCYCEAISR